MSKPPLILGIETSASLCSLCLVSQGEVVASCEEDIGFGHASVFFRLLEDLEKASGLSLEAITHVAVNRGPGSFTGLRVGLSIAKGFSFAGNIPLLGLTAFEIIHQRFSASGKILCVLDTKRQDFYAAFFDQEASHTPEILTQDQTLKKLSDHEGTMLLTDAPGVFPMIQNKQVVSMTAVDVAMASAAFLEKNSALFSTNPFYMRPPKVFE